MGFNARGIQLHLLTVLQVSFEKSYTSMRKHPRVSCALLVFLILYIFLSFIFNLLIFLSPFLVCTAILVRIFWSSEHKNNKCVETIVEEEKKRVEAKDPPKVIKNEKRGMLYKYPSQNATSRRRNFTGKKLEVYGDLEQKAKDLSAVFRNEFTKKNSDLGDFTYLEKEIGSLGYKLPARKPEAPIKQTMFSEPSMLDLVTCGARNDGQERKMEDEKKAQEDNNNNNNNNKAVESKEENNDQKNQMELRICGMESNKRLESLIARRRARKQLRLQIENGLIDIESISPSQISPLFISRISPFDSPKEIDGIEMPGSAPSGLRSPFDIPYDPFEEKPNLKGDSFYKEFSNDLKLEPRLGLGVKDHRLANQRVKTLSGLGNHDMHEQLISEEGSESEQAPSPFIEGEETTQEIEGKFEIDMVRMEVEEVDNVVPTNSIPHNASEPNLIPTITNVERVIATPKPHNGVLEFPISSTASVTDINDSLYESLSTPTEKKKNMSLPNGHISHMHSCSLASDLQVEFSEIGSPTLTVDESHDTLTTTDEEYDGDVDRDVTSGSEDMWGASLHTTEVRGISEHDLLEANNWRDIANSSVPLQNIDEENAADVSSMSSRSDVLEDTPTHAMSSDHNNIFGNVRETVASQASQYSSDVLARWKRLMRRMDTRVNKLPQEIVSEKPEESNQTENLINKPQVIRDMNNSAGTEQDYTEDLGSNGEPVLSVVPQETADEISTTSSSSSSPRSVLPIQQKTVADQEIHQGAQQYDMEDVAQETVVNGDSLPQNIQPSMADPNVESHNSDLGHSQGGSYPLENSIQESNMCSNMNDSEVNNKEDRILKNDENIFTPPIRLDASAEPHRLEEKMTSEDMTEKSRELYDNKVPLIPIMLETSSETHIENEETQPSMREETSTEPFTNDEATAISSATDFEGKQNDLNDKVAILSSSMSEGESGNLSENCSSEEVNYLQSESKEEVNGNMERKHLDNGNISEDSPLPTVTEVSNAEDSSGESDKMNKNEVTDQELHRNNETMVLSESEGVSDKISNKE